MKITLDIYPIKIVNGEDVKVPDDYFSEEKIKEMIKDLIAVKLADLSDSREDFVFISNLPRPENR